MRARVLFVDDEPAILAGLRDMLWRERKRWDMTFVSSGDQALAEMRRAPFHIVVTDMRMPGMDGAELLGHVRSEFPSTARLVLSGHAEREAVMRALPVAHQYLSKPCDAQVLRLAIERTHGLMLLLQSESVRAAVGNLHRLPSGASTYRELTEAISDPSRGIADIVRIVRRDPAMTVKVLQLVNSAYFGAPHQVTSIQHAVTYLGVDMLKGLALTANVFAALEANPIPGFSLEQLQRHSVLTARLAKRIATSQGRAEEAFTAGLVHDVGKIVLALSFPEQFGAIIGEVVASGRPSHEVEREVLGVSHDEVGAYLLGVWGLPFTIVESVAYHHSPSRASEAASELLSAVHVADALIGEHCLPGGAHSAENRLDAPFLERTGLSLRLAELRAMAADEAARAPLPSVES